ncbi:MAG TPA: Zn-dependent hydrolase [Pseudonocardiaceae bacterium]
MSGTVHRAADDLRTARALRVDGARLLSRLEELRRIGGTPDGGVNRVAFTPEDVRGRELVASFMVEAGLDVELDAAGNLIGRRTGRRAAAPTLLMGSHLDTVPHGGALDGAYGVIGAVEVLHTLGEHGVVPWRPMAVIAFTNEEGGLGTRPMWGSHALAGHLGPADLLACDDAGTPVSRLLAGVGGDPARLATAVWPPERLSGYLELHVEQGPVLEHVGAAIGVVQAVTGRVTADVTVRGQANHAGTTPMHLRQDALVGAARVVLAVRELAGDGGLVRVATVGRCAVEPNAWNVVPALVRLRVDLRDVSVAAMRAGLERLRAVAAEVAAATGTDIEVTEGGMVQPAACDPFLQRLVAAAAERVGASHHALPSGAGHDAQVVGTVTRMGMIFVPSRGGISHAAAEWTEPWQLVAGADVLLQTALDFDRALG